MDYEPPILYDVAMTNTSELLTKSLESSISAAVKTAFVPATHSVVAEDLSSGSVTTALELAPNPALDVCCLWCGRAFNPRPDRRRSSAAQDTASSSGSRRVAGR